jgi:uncharacterized iron-regulated membrane protein
MKHKFFALLLLVISALLMVACGAAAESQLAKSDMAMEEAGAIAPASMAPMPAEPAPGYADGASVPVTDFLANATAQSDQARVIIYTGNISLVVKDTQEAGTAITQQVQAQGGYVSGSNVYQTGEILRGTVTVRVPADRFQPTLEQLRAMSLRVAAESSNSEDVTAEFTDLQARKTNLEHTEAALQKLLDERQRVGSTSDILEVYRELTTVRGEIEQIEGRMRYLANQAALSTITIDLTPDALYQPVTIGGWQPQGVAKEALQALITTLQGLINVVIWLLIFALPLLIIFILPLVLLVMLIRWWWKRREAKKPAAPKPAKPQPTPKDPEPKP